MSSQVFDLDHFIAKFEAIPEDRWCEGSLQNSAGQRCALGHCGMTGIYPTDEALTLDRLLDGKTSLINDARLWSTGIPDASAASRHPKTRILAALRAKKLEDRDRRETQ